MKCPICLETINDYTQQYKTLCNHFFCIECLDKWNQSKQQNYNLCPICRQDITTIIINIPLTNENIHHRIITRSNQRIGHTVSCYNDILFTKLLCSLLFIFFFCALVLIISTL
jgi:hypothetical protein